MLTNLKLELRAGESVSIGNDVILTLEQKSGQTARLSIQAPRERMIRKVHANDNAETTDHIAEMHQ